MSFGQELKDFAAGFNTTYNAMADRRDKKWQRDRAAIQDPIDNDYKKASTEGLRLRNKWYEPIAEQSLAKGANDLKWADKDHQARIDASNAAIFGNFFGRGRGKPGEVLSGDTPDGEPDASGAPVGGSAIPTPDDSATDAIPDSDTGGEDTGGDEAPAAENMSYRPGGPANSQGDIYARFMQTVYRAGVKNPNGLAAIAATANRESKFAPAHAYGSWSDPSESGAAGTAGGIMSWRGARFNGLRQFAAKNGDNPNQPSPETQAMYLFHEDPQLKDRLNSAKTPQEAQQYMNQAWAFAGYDRDSPERRARFGLAQTYAEKFNQYLNGSETQALATGGAVQPQHIAQSEHFDAGRHANVGAGYTSPARRQAIINGDGMAQLRGMFRRNTQPVIHAATGGAIPALPEDQQDTAPQQALPVNAPVPTPRPDTSGGNDSEPTAADVGYDPSVAGDPRVVGFTRAHEAVLDGIRYSLAEVGLNSGAAVTDPDRAAKMAAYLKGTGAAPKAIIDQAYAAVDPKNELPESERTMAALGTVYDHYIKRGEPQKAKAAAASIVQYQRKLFQQYASIAKAAVADGDIDAATKAAVKAYSSVPDGQDMKVKKLDDGRYQIDITDEATGKTISKPVLTPQEIGGWAMKVSPGSFDEFIMQAAGQRKQGGGAPSEDFQKLASGLDEGKLPSNADMAKLPMTEQKELRMRVEQYQKTQGAGGVKPPTYSESNTVRSKMMEKFDEMAGQTMPDTDEPVHPGMGDLKPFDKTTISNAAADILGSPNNRSADYNVSEEDAISAAFIVSQSDGYKVTPKGNGKVVELPDGTEVWMPKQRFNQLLNIHKRDLAAAKKAAQDATNASEDAAAKSKRREDIDKKNRTDRPGLLGDQSVPPPTMGGTPQKALDDLQKLMGQ